jgi:hypothetical protein
MKEGIKMEKIKKITKSKEFKILIYFIFIMIVIIAFIIALYKMPELHKDGWIIGPDIDGDGVTSFADVFGYIFFGGLIGDIVINLMDVAKIVIKILNIPICIILQIIAVAVKKHKKVFNNITVIINLASSVLALVISIVYACLIQFFGKSIGILDIIISVILYIDIIISIILLIYNNKRKKEKLDLYNIEESEKNME